MTFFQSLVTFALVALMSASLYAKESQANPRLGRPFRIGMIKMNPDLDKIKPLAESDNGGFVIRGDVIIGSFDQNYVRAYNKETKKNVWWFKTEGELTAPPLLVEGNLFFSTRSGNLTALNASTGELLWTTQLDSYSERPLTLSNGFLYIVTTSQVAYAIELKSGKRLWVHDAGFPDGVIVRRPPAPLIHDGRVIIGLSTGELLALKIEDGKRLWRYNPFYQESRFKDVIGEMIVHNGRLIISRYDGLIAMIDFDQERQVIWQSRQTSVSTSTFRSGRYYVGLTNGEILCFDATSGRINWRTTPASTPAFMLASETYLYVIGTNGRISALDSSSGQFQWGDNLGSRIGTAPIVNSDQMYIGTGFRNIYAYKIQ
jgi:outer membrane protein assembly factor BamB